MRSKMLAERSRRRCAVWIGPAFAGLLLCAASSASAQDCQTDEDCGAGRVCHTEQYESCTGDCKPDMMCAPGSCETLERKSCVNAPCSADADCPSSMRCHAPTYSECSGGGMTGCDPGLSGCPAPEPVDAGCHEVTGDPTCTPRYQLPCSTAADCGPGFACEEQLYTVCSGGGMGGRPAGDAVDAGSIECHTEASGVFACRLLELPCDTDADCGDGLECQNNPSVPGCGSADAGSSSGGGSPGSMMALADIMGCDPGSAPARVCAPHDYYGGMNPPPQGGDGGVDNGGGETKDAGAPGEGGAGTSGGGGTSGGAVDAGSGTGGDGSNQGHHHHGGHLPHFACSASGDASSQSASWFGLVGLIAFSLRRRARASRA